MDNTPISGCTGCQTSAGRMACSTHGGQQFQPSPGQSVQPQVEHYQLDGIGMTVDHCTPTREQQVRWMALQGALTIRDYNSVDVDKIITMADAFESYLLNGKSEVN